MKRLLLVRQTVGLPQLVPFQSTWPFWLSYPTVGKNTLKLGLTPSAPSFAAISLLFATAILQAGYRQQLKTLNNWDRPLLQPLPQKMPCRLTHLLTSFTSFAALCVTSPNDLVCSMTAKQLWSV